MFIDETESVSWLMPRDMQGVDGGLGFVKGGGKALAPRAFTWRNRRGMALTCLCRNEAFVFRACSCCSSWPLSYEQLENKVGQGGESWQVRT